jgi:hypothetical protein
LRPTGSFAEQAVIDGRPKFLLNVFQIDYTNHHCSRFLPSDLALKGYIHYFHFILLWKNTQYEV